MSSASHESFASIHPPLNDHQITFSVARFMPTKCVLYRYFQILKDPQSYCPMLIQTVNTPISRAHVSPHTEIDDRIFS